MQRIIGRREIIRLNGGTKRLSVTFSELFPSFGVYLSAVKQIEAGISQIERLV
jgi:hypothetical protein